MLVYESAQTAKTNLKLSILKLKYGFKRWPALGFASVLRLQFKRERELYWWSPKQSQHSENLKFNSKCFITIFDSHDKEGEGSGIYLQCEAYELSDSPQLEEAISLYNQKAEQFKLGKDICLGDAPTRLYAAKIISAWRNVDRYDQNNNFYDAREPLSLSN